MNCIEDFTFNGCTPCLECYLIVYVEMLACNVGNESWIFELLCVYENLDNHICKNCICTVVCKLAPKFCACKECKGEDC